MSMLVDDLRAEIAKGRVLVIAGAGIAIGATRNAPSASWTGLLESGVARCLEVVPQLPHGWADRVRGEIASGDVSELLSAAEKVSIRLGAPDGPEYSRWLRETVGRMRASDPSVIYALAALPVRLLTTNYDGLIEDVTGWSSAVWSDKSKVERILSGDDKGVIHLHGHWERPASVVLGIRSYDAVLGDAHTQAVLQAARTLKTLLFVGFGAGLEDPNLGALLAWSRRVFAGSEYRHFRLARECDVAGLQQRHALQERVFILPFGKEHSDLAPFLHGLRPPSIKNGCVDGMALSHRFKANSTSSAVERVGMVPALSKRPRSHRPEGGTLVGRDEDLAWLRHNGDSLLLGQPGTGKTFLLARFAATDGGMFAVSDDPARIIEDAITYKPKVVIFADAHLNPDLPGAVRHLRDEMGLTFRIIADSWPGAGDTVMRHLAVREQSVRRLERLTRDQMVAVINDAGIGGPDGLITEILNQSEGRPGLAVTLCHICKAEGFRAVALGDALSRDIRTTFEALVGQSAAHILAAFAVGGRAGMDSAVVARHLGLPPVDVARTTAGLAAGGVLDERSEGRVAVFPATLRYVMVRDIFFRGAGKLPIQELIESAPNITEAALTLMGARFRGAPVPEEDLYKLVLRARDSDVSRNFVRLGADQARRFLDEHPEQLLTVAREALHSLPERAVPLLLTLAVGDARPLNSNPEHPLRLLEDWAKSARPDETDVIPRREALLSAALNWLDSGGSPSTAFRAAAAAFRPDFQVSSEKPGSGDVHVMSFGYLAVEDLERLAGLWPSLLSRIRGRDINEWRPLRELLTAWSYPGSSPGPVSEEASEYMRTFAAQMLRDVVGAVRHRPAVTRELQQFSDHLGVALTVESDAEFDSLYPSNDHSDWREDQKRQLARVSELFESWSALTPEEVVRRLMLHHVEAQALSWNGDGWSTWMCGRFAEKSKALEVWLAVLRSAQAPAAWSVPFLSRLVQLRAPQWTDRIVECFGNQEFRRWAAVTVLTGTDMPPFLVALALDRLDGLGDAIRHLCWDRAIPEERVGMLLRHGDGRIASSAAIGEFDGNGGATVREGLSKDWSAAVVAHVVNEYALFKIFETHGAIAFDWLLARLREEEEDDIAGLLENGHIRAALQALSADERSRLVDALVPGHRARGLVRELISLDPRLYPRLLADEHRKPLHLAPLEWTDDPPAINAWIGLAQMAMDAGYPPKKVALAASIGHFSWIGNLSDKWNQTIARTQPLLSHDDPRVVLIGRIITDDASERRANALKQERDEAVFGRRR